MSKKVKLPITEQVSYMRDHCGIQFEICPEDDAVKFLSNSNYFFKVKAFAKDYPKNQFTGNYNNLDFAYLRELSLLDAYLRKEVISIAVDIEHFLKVGLISAISADLSEDGYDLMDTFFQRYPSIRTRFKTRQKILIVEILPPKWKVRAMLYGTQSKF